MAKQELKQEPSTQKERELLAQHDFKAVLAHNSDTVLYTRKLTQGFHLQLQKGPGKTLWRGDIFQEHWPQVVNPQREWLHIHSIPQFTIPYRPLDYVLKMLYVYFETKFKIKREDMQSVPPIDPNAPNDASVSLPGIT